MYSSQTLIIMTKFKVCDLIRKNAPPWPVEDWYHPQSNAFVSGGEMQIRVALYPMML
jgi:hypothetical protein